jgi:hypothetical protein
MLMVSVVHTSADEVVLEQDEEVYRIPAGGRWMPMDWDRIGEAFESASRRLGWDADFEFFPERQRVVVHFPADRPELVGSTMTEFYRLVAAAIGMEEFMSIWIDYLSRP